MGFILTALSFFRVVSGCTANRQVLTISRLRHDRQRCNVCTQSSMNTLYYGDNLKILRDYTKDESVDLIYLDPPSNSNRNYNVLFKDESGTEADSEIHAFEDTWHWNLKADSETVA